MTRLEIGPALLGLLAIVYLLVAAEPRHAESPTETMRDDEPELNEPL